ncbi:MAG: hypothetical protein ABIO70_19210 [Pseudomonadota bacterium]
MKAYGRALLVLAGLVIGVLGAEGLARVCRPPAGADLLFALTPMCMPAGLYRPHPTLGMEPVPGFAGELRLPGQVIPVRINREGLRGPEPDLGRPRWLALGDSFTLALQVPEEDTFEALLGADLGLQVLNGGIEATGTRQALERYRLVDDRIGVVGVVHVFFTGNDLVDNQRPPQVSAPLEGPVRGRPAQAPLSGLVHRLFQHSYLATVAAITARRLSLLRRDSFDARRVREELLPFSEEGCDDLAALVPATRAALGALRDEASARGDRLLVAVAPPIIVVDSGRAGPTLGLVGLEHPALEAPQQAVIQVLRELDIATCDLTPALSAAQAGGAAPYLPLDGHWSAEGHRAVADALAACLQVGLGPPAPTPPDRTETAPAASVR